MNRSVVFAPVVRAVQRLTLLVCTWLLAFMSPGALAAEPAQVTIGVYLNKVLDVSFKDSKFSSDFYIWFRWKPVGALADFKPLDTFGLVNGKIDSKTVVDEKRIGDEMFASARVTATISKSWELANFPFDQHTVRIQVEDEKAHAGEMVYVVDKDNSALGDEVGIPGWTLSNFVAEVTSHQYSSNYGDVSLPTGNKVSYSRLSFGMDMDRSDLGTPAKLLSTLVVATLLAFLVFWIVPSAVDPRFGLGVGSLFAVSASAFVVASSVPDSAPMTVADRLHAIGVIFIFLSILMSTISLHWAEAGQPEKWKRLDRWCQVLFPGLFLLAVTGCPTRRRWPGADPRRVLRRPAGGRTAQSPSRLTSRRRTRCQNVLRLARKALTWANAAASTCTVSGSRASVPA